MLLNMHIKNLALMDEIDIGFEEHLNILTGETGAGKSIIIGSLGICLGGRFSKELLRDEEQDGLVELLFSVEEPELLRELAELGVTPSEDGELLISRRLSKTGRCINRVNDETVTVGRLRDIASLLVDLHAQHEQQTLLKPARHLEILDRFGGEELSALKERFRACYDTYHALLTEKDENAMDEAEKNKRLDFLRYEIQEIEAANLLPHEDEELAARYKRGVNAKELLSVANEMYGLTGCSAGCAAEQLGAALTKMRRLAELDENLLPVQEILSDADSVLADFNRELSAYMRDLSFDEKDFRQTEARLDLVNSLKAKYGQGIEEIQASLEGFHRELDRLLTYESYMEELDRSCKEAKAALDAAAEKLREKRVAVSEGLCDTIRHALSELNFSEVRFEMRFFPLEDCGPNGAESAVFYISTNVGEELRPLHEVASGGELSRVMLAMKSSLAEQDEVPTLVFDEIDVGISGRTAQKVAEQMSVIGRRHQLICITHLPQIAAMADSHYVIEKKVENNKTISNIRPLKEDEQIQELARLLGGAQITDSTYQAAKEMKALAKQAKLN